MKDWLGKEYDVGDLIIYARMSGRSCMMTIARVVKFGNNTVTVLPIKGSRWKSYGGRTRYKDKRTGKGIDANLGAWDSRSPGVHIERKSGWILKETGEFYSYDQWRDYWRNHSNPVLDYKEKQKIFDYAPTVYKDYVEVVDGGVPHVTLRVTENITKWDGELGEAEQA